MTTLHNTMTGKRRQPFFDRGDASCDVEMCVDNELMEHDKKIVCECDLLCQSYPKCSQYESLAVSTFIFDLFLFSEYLEYYLKLS